MDRQDQAAAKVMACWYGALQSYTLTHTRAQHVDVATVYSSLLVFGIRFGIHCPAVIACCVQSLNVS
jgi:hypothetical protein